MASLGKVVRDTREIITDGIAWVVVYKNRRSWEWDYFYPDSGSYDEGFIFDEEDMEQMKRISSIDHKAICFNGYFMGFSEDFTLKEIENKIIYFYIMRLNQLNGDFIGGLVVEK